MANIMETDSPEQNSAAPAAVLVESRWRSIAKGLTWRILATGTTVIIAHYITGDVGVALKIGAIEVFAKIAVYYFHERAWQKVPIGLKTGKLPAS